jgi:hypothetical protein
MTWFGQLQRLEATTQRRIRTSCKFAAIEIFKNGSSFEAFDAFATRRSSSRFQEQPGNRAQQRS